MKALEKGDKDLIKIRFAAGLFNAVKNSAFKSFRKLAKEAGMEPAHIQKISSGKLDISLTTCISIASALNISYSQLSAYYDEVSEQDLKDFKEYLETQRKLHGGKETKSSKNSKKSHRKNF